MAARKLVRRANLLDIGQDAIRPRDVIIEQGTILDVVPGGSVSPDAYEVVEGEGYLILPGLINCHTHSTGNLAKGLGERWTLELQLNATNFLYRERSTEEKYLSALIGALDMVSAGCTACYDLVFEWPQPSHEGLAAVAKAYDDIGLRAIVAPMLSSQSFYKAVPGLLEHIPPILAKRACANSADARRPVLDLCREILDRWPNEARARPGLAPSIPMHCSDELLVGCVRLADEFGCSVHTHLAESKIQALKSEQKYGTSLTSKLADIGFLGSHLVAAHAIWIDERDIELLARSKTRISLNPASNMRLGSGVAPARQLIASGAAVGLGTDSAICSDSLNMFVAMRAAALVYALHGYDRGQWLTPKEVLTLATSGGAKVLGREHDLGRIERGYRADMAFLDMHSIALIPLNSPVNQLARCEEGRGVRHVMIDGEFTWLDGRPQSANLASVARHAMRSVERLQRLYHLSDGAMDELEQLIDRYCTALATQPFRVNRHLGGAPSRPAKGGTGSDDL
jgi:guanine deaminase